MQSQSTRLALAFHLRRQAGEGESNVPSKGVAHGMGRIRARSTGSWRSTLWCSSTRAASPRPRAARSAAACAAPSSSRGAWPQLSLSFTPAFLLQPTKLYVCVCVCDAQRGELAHHDAQDGKHSIGTLHHQRLGPPSFSTHRHLQSHPRTPHSTAPRCFSREYTALTRGRARMRGGVDMGIVLRQRAGFGA